jgi:hypothetical protein
LNNGKPWKTMENNGVFAALQKKWSPKIGSEEMKAAKRLVLPYQNIIRIKNPSL